MAPLAGNTFQIPHAPTSTSNDEIGGAISGVPLQVHNSLILNPRLQRKNLRQRIISSLTHTTHQQSSFIAHNQQALDSQIRYIALDLPKRPRRLYLNLPVVPIQQRHQPIEYYRCGISQITEHFGNKALSN